MIRFVAPWWLKILPLTFIFFCCATPKGRPAKGGPPVRLPSPGRPIGPMPWVLLLIVMLAGACKTSQTEDLAAHLDAQEDIKLADLQHAESSGETHEGPGLELSFALLAPDAGPQPPDGLPAHGALLKAVFRGTVDDRWRASSDGLQGAETQIQASGDVAAKKTATVAPAGSCAFGAGLFVPLIVAGVVGLLWLRRTWLLGLLKKIAGLQ